MIRNAGTGKYIYDAFISYSHAADGHFAPALQQALHRFAKPWYKRRAMHAFRDQTNLAINPHLWGSIEEALSKSRFFLLLASPTAADSKWVRREVEYWLRERSPETLLIVLTAGELKWDDVRNRFDPEQSDALPEILFDAFSEEPLFVDFRWARAADDLSLRNARFHQLTGRIAATIRGAEPDELFGEDVRQFRRTQRTAWTAVMLLVVLTTLSIVFATMERQATQTAKEHLALRYLQDGRRELIAGRSLRALAYMVYAFKVAPFLPDAGYMVSSAARILERRKLITASPAGLRNAVISGQAGRAALTDNNGIVTVWDIENKERIFQSALKSEEQSFIRLSEDGKWLITGTSGAPLHLWDVDSGKLSHELPEISGDVVDVSLDNKAGRMVVVYKSGLAQLWDIQRKLLVKEIDFNIQDAALSREGKYMITGSGNGFIGIWNPEQGNRLALIEAAGDTETSRTIWSKVVFSSAHRKAVISGNNGNIVVLDLAEEVKKSRVIPLKMDKPVSLSNATFSFDGKYVAAMDWRDTSYIWDAENGKQIMAVKSHLRSDLSGGSVSISRDNKFFMTMAVASREAKLWTVADGDLVMTIDGPPGWLLASVISADSAGLVTADRDGGLVEWEFRPDGGQMLLPLAKLVTEPRSAAFSANGRMIAIGGMLGKLAIFDTLSGALDRQLSLGDEAFSVTAIALDENGTRVLAGGINSAPKLWNLDIESESVDLNLSTGSLSVVADVKLSKDGNVAATVTNREGVVIWGGNGMNPLFRLPDIKAYRVALSPDNKLLATSSLSSDMIINIETGRQDGTTLQATGDDRTTLVFNNNGTRLAAGGSRGTSWIWDAKSGIIESTLEGHSGRVRSLVWTKDGSHIVTSGNDGTVRVWNADSGDLQEIYRCGERMLMSVVDTESDRSLLVLSKGGWLQRWSRPSPSPDLDRIERLSECHQPWQIVEGALVPKETNPDSCL